MEEDKTPYQYIVVRKDLPVEVQMINVGHAAGESIIEAPIPSTTRLVLLHAENENALLEIEGVVKAKGYHCVLIREPDEPYNNAAMSLGLAPSTKRNQLRKLFYHFQALKLD
jgi:hypothetical protein